MNLQPILNAVRQSALLCRQVQENYLVASEKEGNEPVTIADYGSQALICRAISTFYPDDAVISEESGAQFLELVTPPQRQTILSLIHDILHEPITETDIVTWLNYGKNRHTDRTWIIDPIDGTKGFLANSQYAIAVGILESKQITGGIMGSPRYREAGLLCHAYAGEVFAQSLFSDTTAPTPIRVSERTLPQTIYIAESVEPSSADYATLAKVYAHFPHVVEHIHGQDKYAMVAKGDADLYIRIPPPRRYNHNVWDHAAGYALVIAAGGKVTDLDGTPLDFSQGKILPNEGIVASNGHIHEAVIEAIAKVFVTL